MGFFDGLSSLGSGLWQGAKNVGDFAGLDGSLGYQGTWNHPSLGSYSMDAGAGIGNINNGSYLTDQSTVPQPSMLSSLGDWMKNQTSRDWANYGSLAKGIGGLGLGYLNYQNGKNMQDMYKQQMAFNQAQINDAEARRKRAQNSMQGGFENSSLATL